jgi:hypothetical protein
MFQKVDVAIQFRDQLVGGLPKSKKVLETYLEAKFGKPIDNFLERLADDLGINDEGSEEFPDVTDDLEEKRKLVITGFKRDEHGLYLSDYQIKAMLKQCASLLKITTAVRGSRQVFHEGLVVRPPRLYLDRMAPDGMELFCGHVMTMQGKRSVLRKSEIVRQATIAMQVWILDTKVITLEHLRQCFELGQEVGLGSCRSFEQGKFDVIQFELGEDA